MADSVTISFVSNRELRDLLRHWAKQDDRSVSSIVRQVLMQEIQRREQAQSAKQHLTNHHNN